MPEKRTLKRAAKAKREGKAPSTQAGEFVREEMEHMKRGKHPIRNRQQAIAIGLSKAHEAGVDIPEKARKSTTKATKKAAGKPAPKKAAKKAAKKANYFPA